MKKLGLIVLSIAFLFAMIGCKEDATGGKNPGVKDDGPVINGISYVREGGTSTAIVRDGTINVDYQETITLTANVSNADTYSWTSDPSEHVVHISHETSITATVQGTIIAGGEAEITFTAKNGDLTGTPFKFKIVVAPRPSVGLFYYVWKGSVKEDEHLVYDEDDNDFEMLLTSSGLTFTAESIEDGSDASSKITWSANPAGFVNLSAATGGTVSITPIKNGTVTITTTAPSDKYEDKKVEFKITVKGVAANVIFQWNASEEPWVTRNSGVANQGGVVSSTSAWTPQNAEYYMLQDNNKRVTTVQLYRHQDGGNAVQIPENGGGFRLGAANNEDQPVFTIGQKSYVRTLDGDTLYTKDLEGEIDLLRKKVKLTIEYANIVKPASATRNILQILINNNRNSSAHSMFDGNTSSIKTYAVNNPSYPSSGMPNIDGPEVNTAREKHIHNSITNTGLIELTIDTRTGKTADDGFGTDLNGQDYEAGLKNAFISFYSQGAGAGNGDNFITITSIKLELLESEVYSGILNLDIKDDDNADATLKIHDLITGDDDYGSAEFTASSESGVSYVWSSDKTDIASVNAIDGVATVTAVGEGTAIITVKAVKTGYIQAVKKFSVKVTDPGVAFNPLIFEWSHSANAVTGNTDGNLNGNGYVLTGSPTGRVTTAKIRSGAAVTGIAVVSTGIKLFGSTASQRVIIGSGVTTATSTAVTNWASTHSGDFDFSATTAMNHLIKISFDYEVTLASTNNARTIGLLVNNSNNGPSNVASPLSPCLINEVGSNQSLAVSATNQNFEAILDPSIYTSDDAKTSLNNAFINITAGTGGSGYDFIIKSIKIEYVERQ